MVVDGAKSIDCDWIADRKVVLQVFLGSRKGLGYLTSTPAKPYVPPGLAT